MKLPSILIVSAIAISLSACQTTSSMKSSAPANESKSAQVEQLPPDNELLEIISNSYQNGRGNGSKPIELKIHSKNYVKADLFRKDWLVCISTMEEVVGGPVYQQDKSGKLKKILDEGDLQQQVWGVILRNDTDSWNPGWKVLFMRSVYSTVFGLKIDDVCKRSY